MAGTKPQFEHRFVYLDGTGNVIETRDSLKGESGGSAATRAPDGWDAMLRYATSAGEPVLLDIIFKGVTAPIRIEVWREREQVEANQREQERRREQAGKAG